MKKFWLPLLALAFCACKQSEAPQKTADKPREAPGVEAASPPFADARPIIACFGDSLTAGMGLDPGQSYPDLLQKEMDRRGYAYRLANFGVSGDTTQDGLMRLPLVMADKPTLVVLEFGANDGLRGQPLSNTQNNLSQMIEALQRTGIRVVLAGITLPPNYGPDYIRKFDAMFPELASKYKLTLIPFLLEGVGGNPRLMQRDGLHPNAEGTKTVAATVLKHIEPLLKK
jgi:acyl-CoA thioesterase-1